MPTVSMSITATGHNQIAEGAQAFILRDNIVMHDYVSGCDSINNK